MTMQGNKLLNKNFIIAGIVLLVIGLAVAIGVTLSSEPIAAGLPEGETTINGENLPKRKNVEARLAFPEGINGRIFLVYSNYKNILYYNCSTYYAISIGILSDEIIN